VSQQPARRRGGSVPLIAIVAIAMVLWYIFARPVAPSEQTASPTAPATAPVVAESNAASEAGQATETEAASPAIEEAAAAPAGEDGAADETEQVAKSEVATPALEEPAAAAAPAATATATPKPARPTATPTRGPPDTYDGYPVITYDELPPEALDTLALIDSDGPFPYSKDGSTFQSRERLLPRKPNGYYSEYTVITPGENDRGARRIIGGDEGERYYTDDHYASFYWIWIP